MFGNVMPAVWALSAEDKELFRDYYCSLCREIGKRSQPARLGLSYDMTFLALLLGAIADADEASLGRARCPLHPKRHTRRLAPSDALCYASDMSVLLIKAKAADDAHDDKNPFAWAMSAIIRSKADGREMIDEQLCSLSSIEKEDVRDPDRAADCFAVLTAKLFSPQFVPNAAREALYWLGYNIGRWVYLLDAYDDLERDLKKGSYNPFAPRTKADIYHDVEETLYFTLSQAAAAFDLLPVKRYKSLLENIIYIGLPARSDYVLSGSSKGIKGNEPI